MSLVPRRTQRRGAGVAALMVLGSILLTGPATAAPGDPDPGTVTDTGTDTDTAAAVLDDQLYPAGQYIVALDRAPIAAYTGGVADIPATKPAPDSKVQVDSAAAQDYAAVIEADQQTVAASVGVAPERNYTVALNAFVAQLSSEQATTLADTPGVLAVAKDDVRYATDDRNSVDYLGLSGNGGVWNAVGGAADAGKGVVVGVIDSGIWPDNPSFAGDPLGDAPDPTDPGKPYRNGDQIVMTKANGATFTGECQEGEQFTADLCNTKVISARYFGDTTIPILRDTLKTLDDYISPLDKDGHGSHTAGTAAGNAGVGAVVDGRDFGAISGVAPGAKIAVYKALWKNGTTATGYTSDLIAAIDQAVADGVDVINYSVGGATESASSSLVASSFLVAASAGIFVSASAGNSGPGPSTMDNTAPWVTTVAASTVAPYAATVELGNGAKYLGSNPSVTAPVGPAPLIAAEAAGLAGKTPAEAALCTPGTLDPAKVAGKIVECDRGVVARVAKSAEVLRAGGIGMVLANLVDNSLEGDLHAVPTVQVNPPGAPAIKAYALTAGATATLVPGNTSSQTIPYPQVAGFSSRGPALQTGGGVLKPDIAAPGVAILAPFSPAEGGRQWNFLSGTSMSAPHIAGLAAIYKAVHPDWTPMAIKSALMTTATDTLKPDGTPNTDPFAQGAGEVNPRAMLSPGLIYPAGDSDWLGYLEGLGVKTNTGVPAIDPKNYNQASFFSNNVVDRVTFTRRVTSQTTGYFQAQASVPGYTVSVSPSILFFWRSNQTRTFTVTLTATTAPTGQYTSGSLTWRGGAGTPVRSPIAVYHKALVAPAEVTMDSATNTATWPVTSGVNGAFPIKSYGMAAGTVQPGSVTATTFADYRIQALDPTQALRLVTAGTGPPGADIDLYLYYLSPTGTAPLVGSATGITAAEQITLADPAPGTYVARVRGYSNAAGTTTTPYTLTSYVVAGAPNSGSLVVQPANTFTTPGQRLTVTATAAGLDPALPYLGWAEYLDGSGTFVARPR